MLELGLFNRGRAGAIQIDSFGYSRGVHRPTGEDGELDVLFVRGDVNDDREVTAADPVALLESLFLRSGVVECLAAADADDSATVNISDPVRLLRFIFLAGNPPPTR